MSGELIGYTHSLFSGNLRKVAEKFDKKTAGGNENGLIDGKEIKLFSDYVQQHYSYTIDFSQLKQSELREVENPDRRTKDWSPRTAAEMLAQKYENNGMNTTIASYLNGDTRFETNKAKIAYLSENDYKESKDYADKAEAQVRTNIDKEKNPPKKEEVQPRDNLDRGIFRLIDWLFG